MIDKLEAIKMVRKKYTFEEKKAIVESFFEGQSADELAGENGIGHRSLIHTWVRAVREANTFDVLLPNQGRTVVKVSKQKKVSLEEELERVKLENLYLKKLLDLRKG